jgi:hypothetical protein
MKVTMKCHLWAIGLTRMKGLLLSGAGGRESWRGSAAIQPPGGRYGRTYLKMETREGLSRAIDPRRHVWEFHHNMVFSCEKSERTQISIAGTLKRIHGRRAVQVCENVTALCEVAHALTTTPGRGTRSRRRGSWLFNNLAIVNSAAINMGVQVPLE